MGWQVVVLEAVLPSSLKLPKPSPRDSSACKGMRWVCAQLPLLQAGASGPTYLPGQRMKVRLSCTGNYVQGLHGGLWS